MRTPVFVGTLWTAAAILLAAMPAEAAPGGGRYGAPPPGQQALGGGISFSGGAVPIGNSRAGDDSAFGTGWLFAPNYDDAFDTGWMFRVEPYVDFTPLVRGQFGIAYDEWPGRSYNDGLGSVKFGDLKMTAFYVGARVRFLPYNWVRPYAVADVGVAHYDAVDVTGFRGPGIRTTPYWDSTNTIFFDAGGGAEFYVTPRVAFFVDIRVQVTGKPDSADPPSSDSEGVASVPLTAGVNLSF